MISSGRAHRDPDDVIGDVETGKTTKDTVNHQLYILMATMSRAF
jgi:hypothetical protein